MSIRVVKYDGGGWMVDIRVHLPNRERYRERKVISARSKTAATRWAEERERHLLTHGPVAEAKEVPTLSEFAPRFIQGYALANRHKPSGIAKKETVVKVHLVPQLGDKRLDVITNEDVQRLKHHLKDKAPKTVNNVLTVLNKMLKVAVEWGEIEHVPCTIKLLKVGQVAIRFWDEGEFSRLIDAAEQLSSDCHVAVLLGGDAGLRSGEIRALEWTDVDFVKRQIRVERSVWRDRVTTTKGNRVRWVPMTKRLSKAMQQHRHLRGPRVLCENDGTPITEDTLRYLVERSTRAANLTSERKQKGAGPHVLRHTFCSLLAAKGAPARAIQEIAGHRDLTTTLRYMHLSPLAIDSAIRLLELPPAASVGGNSGATEIVATQNY
jgi:integrase